MIVSFTGHRPNNLFGYDIFSKDYDPLKDRIKETLVKIKPTKAISGMALGADQLCAHICIELNIPFIAAIPFAGQERVWPNESKTAYNDLLAKAEKTHIVCEGGYSSHKLQLRNEWMVDNSDIIISIFNGSSGGTKNCIDYAKKNNKQIIILNPNCLK